MATETGNLGEIEAKLVLEPVDGVTRATGEDADEVVTGEVARRLFGVLEENL